MDVSTRSLTTNLQKIFRNLHKKEGDLFLFFSGYEKPLQAMKCLKILLVDNKYHIYWRDEKIGVEDYLSITIKPFNADMIICHCLDLMIDYHRCLFSGGETSFGKSYASSYFIEIKGSTSSVYDDSKFIPNNVYDMGVSYDYMEKMPIDLRKILLDEQEVFDLRDCDQPENRRVTEPVTV